MSKRINFDKCLHSSKEDVKKVLCRNEVQEEETTRVTTIIPRSTKEVLSRTQHPLTHVFCVLKCEHTLGNTFRQEDCSPSCRNYFPAATNNFPMKGLKYIPILQNPMEVNFHHHELTRNKAILFLRLGDGSKHGQKRNLDSSQKQRK